MRIRMAFLSCTVVATAALLAPTAALATGNWGSCSSFNPNITIVEGPCPVTFNDPLGPSCARPGTATGIKYKNSGSTADHLATLVTANNDVATPSGCQNYSACSGDPLTGLGKHSCHEKAVKINPATQTAGFWVVAQGTTANKTQRLPVMTSIVAKKGSCIKSTAILGLGLEGPSVFQAAKKAETIVFKGCAVKFELDAVTGQVVNAETDPLQSDPGANCSPLFVNDVSELSLTLTGLGDLGAGQIGDGYISTGTNSCTTRVIGGRVYTWGSSCPN
ncbi:MAG TPA: hypothetical protein VI669_13085 [Vicinamibacteria bacterium]